MTQITVPPAVCNECRKEILPNISHHSLAQPEPGKSGFGIHCHEEPVSGAYIFASFALKLALEQRAALLLKEAELKACRTKYKSEVQSNEAALKLKVETEANQQFEVTRLGLVTTHETLMKDLKRQLTDAEQKCAANEALHRDQVEGLKQDVRESERTAEILLGEKTQVLEELAESKRASTELQSQLDEANGKLDEVTETLEQMRQHHRRFSENTLKLCGVLSTLGKRIVVLEKKLGIDDMDDIRRIYREYTGEEPPDLSLDDAAPAGNAAPKVVPTVPTAPPPAPPAVIGTATSPGKNGKSAILVEVHTPVPPAAPVRTTVQFDDASSDAASDASADDEDDDDVDDRQVVETKDADDEDDDVSPPKPAHPTCTFCHDKPAVGRLKFVDKETGAKQELLTCDTQAHGADFLRYLQAKAKGKNWSNMDANDIANLFT